MFGMINLFSSLKLFPYFRMKNLSFKYKLFMGMFDNLKEYKVMFVADITKITDIEG